MCILKTVSNKPSIGPFKTSEAKIVDTLSVAVTCSHSSKVRMSVSQFKGECAKSVDPDTNLLPFFGGESKSSICSMDNILLCPPPWPVGVVMYVFSLVVEIVVLNGGKFDRVTGLISEDDSIDAFSSPLPPFRIVDPPLPPIRLLFLVTRKWKMCSQSLTMSSVNISCTYKSSCCRLFSINAPSRLLYPQFFGGNSPLNSGLIDVSFRWSDSKFEYRRGTIQLFPSSKDSTETRYTANAAMPLPAISTPVTRALNDEGADAGAISSSHPILFGDFFFAEEFLSLRTIPPNPFLSPFFIGDDVATLL